MNFYDLVFRRSNIPMPQVDVSLSAWVHSNNYTVPTHLIFQYTVWNMLLLILNCKDRSRTYTPVFNNKYEPLKPSSNQDETTDRILQFQMGRIEVQMIQIHINNVLNPTKLNTPA